MTYKEIKDRLSKCEIALNSIKDGSKTYSTVKDLAATKSKLEMLKESLTKKLLLIKEEDGEMGDDGYVATDDEGAAEELANNFGTATEFGAMNVIQQEAAAKAVGLTRDTLAQSLMKREALSKLSQFEGETEKEKYENAVKLLGVDGARQKLGNDALADQMESVSLQDRMTAAAQKFQEALIPMAEKVMPAISKLFDFMGKNINGIVLAVKILVPLMLAYKAATIAASIAQIAGASALTMGVAAGIAAGAVALFSGLFMSIGDGIFPADGKGMISPKEGGLFQVSDNDDIVVGPKLAQAVTRGGNTSQNIQNKVNISPSNTQMIVNLNGQAIGNVNARQDYKPVSITALGGNVDYSAPV